MNDSVNEGAPGHFQSDDPLVGEVVDADARSIEDLVAEQADARDPNEIVEGGHEGPIVERDRTADDRAAEIAAAYAAPDGGVPEGEDARHPFRIRLEKNGDPNEWEQGVVYASSKDHAQKVAASAGMVHDGWHIVWVKPVDPADASGLA